MNMNNSAMSEEEFAMKVLITTKVLTSCSIHSEELFSGGEDVECAYKYANKIFSEQQNTTPFVDRRDMTDTIKQVFDEYSGDECPRCSDYRYD